MKVDPMKSYRRPGFPTRAILDAHPALLRLLPKRWQRNTVVLAAVAAACALVIGLRRGNAPGVHVAPLFPHGEGAYMGGWGCIVVTPPVFLSEDEAQFVIRDEALKAGLSFAPTTETLPEVVMPRANPYRFFSNEKADVGLTLDGAEATRNIQYEFVSEADFNHWTVEPIISPRILSGASAGKYSYHLRAAAHTLRRNMRSITRKGTYAVFYDPIAAEETRAHPVILVEGVAYTTGKELTKEFPAHYNVAVDALSDEEQYELLWHMRTNGQIRATYSFQYSGGIVPLKAFCTKKGLTYTWDNLNHTATVTDPATGKTVVFSAGGPLASKLALREQVRDFLHWLKAEGIV